MQKIKIKISFPDSKLEKTCEKTICNFFTSFSHKEYALEGWHCFAEFLEMYDFYAQDF